MSDADQRGIYKRWPAKAAQNEQKWGEQRAETLLLAMQEELGELTQAHLESRQGLADAQDIQDELDDLAALCIQLNRVIHS